MDGSSLTDIRKTVFRVDLRVGTPVDELKSHCACYAEKEEINCTVTVMNRYICGHVEQ